MKSFNADRKFIENKYHKTNEPYDSFSRFNGYHGYPFDESTGLSDEEMAKRKAETTLKVKTNLTGYLKKYAKMVSSADKGAIIDI